MKLHSAFVNWSERQGLTMENPEDLLYWWQCWLDGYNQAIDDVTKVIKES